MNKPETEHITEAVTMRTKFDDNQIGRLPKPTAQQTADVKNDFNKGIRCNECGGWHHPKVIHLDYVGHAALTDRLLDVDSAWGWEPLALDSHGLPALDQDGGMWIKLTVLGVTRLGYGDAQGKTGGNASKERIGDALRNAAMRFGAALDLWHKGELHIDPPNNKIVEVPKVGTEALIAMKDDIPFYPEETARLKACGSINQLSLVYHKLDPPIRFALVAVKDQCKADIIKAEMGATL